MRRVPTLLAMAAALGTTACVFGGGAAAPETAPEAAPAAPAAAAGPSRGAVAAQSPLDVPPRSAAARPAAGARPLFERLGGLPAITAVVGAFVERVAADERINGFFRGVDLANLKRLLTEQICQATGGPCAYSGRDMPTAHRGLGLTDAHFDALVEDLVAALNQFHVPAAEQGELLRALGGMRSQIVGQ